jgi:L-asparagine transporter-like permease
MANILFYSVITLTFVFLFVADPEGTFNFIYRIDAYLTLAWKWLTIAPGYVRMLILQRFMLWKMRRQFKLTRPLPNKF